MTTLVRPAPLVVVMGASGCGKSTVGAALADRLGVEFLDGADLHPPANLTKMAQGVTLSGDDRRPWLAEIGRRLRAHDATGLVVACSALRVVYRDILRAEAPRTFFVHLAADGPLLTGRLLTRTDRVLPASLVADQLQTLEPLRVHEHGVTFPADRRIDRLVREAERAVQRREAFV